VTAGEGDPLLRFVIHEHYARNHHFDLRLERDGTLWSWAVPKGMPTDPARNRLAVRVEDHELSHIDFEDLAPVSGHTGAVRKSIWDHGTYETVKFTPKKLVVDLHGQESSNRYALFQTDDATWMLHLMAK
jgi:bifunctional non-homologous end joining protein LigD